MVSCSSATYGKSGKYQKKAIVTNLRHVHSGQWYFSHLERQCLDWCKKKENKALLSSSGEKKKKKKREGRMESKRFKAKYKQELIMLFIWDVKKIANCPQSVLCTDCAFENDTCILSLSLSDLIGWICTFV